MAFLHEEEEEDDHNHTDEKKEYTSAWCRGQILIGTSKGTSHW